MSVTMPVNMASPFAASVQADPLSRLRKSPCIVGLGHRFAARFNALTDCDPHLNLHHCREPRHPRGFPMRSAAVRPPTKTSFSASSSSNCRIALPNSRARPCCNLKRKMHGASVQAKPAGKSHRKATCQGVLDTPPTWWPKCLRARFMPSGGQPCGMSGQAQFWVGTGCADWSRARGPGGL